jgi:early secretory antigenic target protein ESAT-6
MQQSEVRATKSGITALEMAFSGVTKCRQDVESTRTNLASGYKGSDGKSFQDLVTSWESQCDIVLKNLQDMIHTLDSTLASQHQQQGSSNDSVNQAYNQSVSVFDTLAG